MRVIFLDIDGPMIPGRQYRTKRGAHYAHWVAIDDEKIRSPNAILVKFDAGITSHHIDLAMKLLGVEAGPLVAIAHEITDSGREAIK